MKKEGFFAGLKNIRNIELAVTVLIAAVVLAVFFAGRHGTAQGGSAREKSSDEKEARLEDVLSAIDGAGSVSVIISYGYEGSARVFGAEHASGKVKSVLVVAEGADDIYIKMALIRAVCAAVDVNAANVEVISMKGEKTYEVTGTGNP